MSHKNSHLARSKPAYAKNVWGSTEHLAAQLKDYMFVNSTPRAKADPDRVPFNKKRCLRAITIILRVTNIQYGEFAKLIKNTWVTDEVWFLAEKAAANK